MSFTCTICSLDIQVGEPMLSDERMNLAHKACVDRMVKDSVHPSIRIPSVHLSPPPPRAPPPLAAAPDSCVPTSSVRFCSECGKPCISMCPAPCLQYVHQDFGYNGPNCSGRHEDRCEVARKSRELGKKPPALKPDPLPVYDCVIEPITVRKNGKYSPKSRKSSRKARR